MTRLGLTQRVTVIEEYGERRDCLDQAWTALLEGWDYQPLPLPNTVENVADYLDALALDGLVLTSGNDLAHLEDASEPAPERDRFERAALEWALDRDCPVLGVCRGLEFVNVYFGGELSAVSGHVATDHAVTFPEEGLSIPGRDRQLELPEEIRTNSYHDYGMTRKDVADALSIVATAPDGTIEGLRHDDHPLVAIMWHPERDGEATTFDRQLFDALFGGDKR